MNKPIALMGTYYSESLYHLRIALLKNLYWNNFIARFVASKSFYLQNKFVSFQLREILDKKLSTVLDNKYIEYHK